MTWLILSPYNRRFKKIVTEMTKSQGQQFWGNEMAKNQIKNDFEVLLRIIYNVPYTMHSLPRSKGVETLHQLKY